MSSRRSPPSSLSAVATPSSPSPTHQSSVLAHPRKSCTSQKTTGKGCVFILHVVSHVLLRDKGFFKSFLSMQLFLEITFSDMFIFFIPLYIVVYLDR